MPRSDADPSLVHDGPTRTDLYCHDCTGYFVAEIDYSENGTHIVHCPRCGHKHYRVITGGRVTDERWRPGPQIEVGHHRVWQAGDPSSTRISTASEFIRQRWIDKLQ
jgi:DNA-directed RNA polymerase subunit RPC12/RpoP